MIEREIQRIRERDDLDELRAELMSRDNVHSTGIGYRFSDGERTDEPALFAYVDEKRPLSELPSEDIVPETVRDIRTDVREAGPGIEHDLGSPDRLNERMRPLAGGMNCRRGDGGGGTIALLVQDDDTAGVGALTAHHVIHDGSTEVGTMYQPREDTAVSDNNAIGTPTDWSLSGDDDWGYIELDDSSWLTNEIVGVGAPTTTEEPRFDERLVISSAYQGLVGGELTAVDIQGASRTDYEYRFDEDISLSGASGSATLWYDSDVGEFKVFAMHVAHDTDDNSLKYGNTIQDALVNGGYSLDTGSYTLNPPSNSNTYFEGTVFDVTEAGRVSARVVNVGGGSGSQTIEIRNPSTGTTIDSTSVTLGGLEYATVQLESGGLDEVNLFTGDEEWTTDIGRYTGEWRVVDSLPDYDVPIRGVTADIDENYAVVAPDDNYVDIYEVGTWNHVRQLPLPNALAPQGSSGPTASFSKDNNWLAVACYDTADAGNQETTVFDVSDPDPSNWVRDAGLVGASGRNNYAVDFTPDSSMVVVAHWNAANGDPNATVWEAGTWNQVTQLNTDGLGRGVSFSPDGRYVGLGDSSGNIQVWQIGNLDGTGWNSVISLSPSGSTIGGVDWDDAMRYMIAGSWDNNSYIYNVGETDGTGWSLQRTLMGDASPYSSRFSRDAEYAITPEGYADREWFDINVYQENGGAFDLDTVLENSSGPIEETYFISNRLLVVDREGTVLIYDTPAGPVPAPRNLQVSYA